MISARPGFVIRSFARGSTTDQDPQLQLDGLAKVKREPFPTDHSSGAAAVRPSVDEMHAHARMGDTIVVMRLDRLGHSLRHLIDLVGGLQDRGAGLRSLNEKIATATSGLTFRIFPALAKFGRGLFSERTPAGVPAARARDRVGGRPEAPTPQATEAVINLRREGQCGPDLVASLKVSREAACRTLVSRASR